MITFSAAETMQWEVNNDTCKRGDRLGRLGSGWLCIQYQSEKSSNEKLFIQVNRSKAEQKKLRTLHRLSVAISKIKVSKRKKPLVYAFSSTIITMTVFIEHLLYARHSPSFCLILSFHQP